MEHTYQNFLTEDIYVEQFHIHASFTEENGAVYIVTPEQKILFPMLYKPELHDALLIAAEQWLYTHLSYQTMHTELMKTVKKQDEVS